MDLFGIKRRNKDLMVMERSRHDLISNHPSSGLAEPMRCSCGWQGPKVPTGGTPQAAIEAEFAAHIRARR